MKDLIRILSILIFLSGGMLSVFPQDYTFTHYSSENGLSKNAVNWVLQDRQGFLWVATTDGLNRFDGINFKIFRHEPGNTNSINHSNVLALHEDVHGNIWIATPRGVNKFDPQTGKFESYLHEYNSVIQGYNYILCINSDNEGNIWCGSYHGLYKIIENNEDLIIQSFHHDPNDAKSIASDVIWAVFEDSRGDIWLGTTHGLDKLVDPKSNIQIQFRHFLPDPQNIHSISSDQVWEICEDKWGNLWIGTRNGVNKFDPESETFYRNIHDPANPGSISHNYIFGMLVDQHDRLWIGTYNGGVNVAELTESTINPEFERYTHQPEKPESIISNDVKSFYMDQSGILWIGTSGGLDKIDPNKNDFILVQSSKKDPQSLNSNYIQAIYEDSYGNFWVGTRGGGINFLAKNLSGNKYTGYQHITETGNARGLTHNDVYCFFEDSKNRLWIGTYGGISIIQLTDQIKAFDFEQIKNHNHVKQALTHNYVFDITEDAQGTFWIATYGGLTRLVEDQDGSFVSTFYESDINDPVSIINSDSYTVCLDRNDNLWVGTFMGLCVFRWNGEERNFINFLGREDIPKSLSSDEVFVLYRNKKDQLWAGTIDGLTRISIDAEGEIKFKHFSGTGGPINGAVYGIVEDNSGNLWISGNNGLTVFNPEMEAVLENENEAFFKVYDTRDGLQGREFITRSCFVSEKDEIYFGGKNGFNFFDPNQFISNPNKPPVVFTDFWLFYKSVNPGSPDYSADSPLKNTISHTQSITLKYWQNIFSIEFAALNFTLSTKNKYRYQLEGFDPEWVYAGNNNMATYTNLNPGKYTFLVEAANNDGLWNEDAAILEILVKPPPWRTWYAYLTYGLIGILLVYFYNRYRVNVHRKEIETKLKIERARLDEREDIRRKNAADFHDELGHSITRISLFAELAKREQKSPEALSQYLNKVNENVKALSGGIRDFIWALDPDKDSVYEMLLRLQEFGDKLFEFTSIKFETKGFSEKFNDMHLEADSRRHFLLIFKEAMNNSLKYAACKTIELSAEMEENEICVCLEDDGVGFDPGTIKAGNGLKNMKRRAEKTGSRIDFISNYNSGTKIKLYIKTV